MAEILKEAIYRKQQNRGRAWHIQMLGDVKPELGESVKVLKKNGGFDTVEITGYITATSPFVCTFVNRQWGTRGANTDFIDNTSAQGGTSTPNRSAAVPADDFMGNAEEQKAVESMDTNSVKRAIQGLVQDVYNARDQALGASAETKRNTQQVAVLVAELPGMAEKALAEAAAKAIGTRVQYIDVSGNIKDCGRQHKTFARLLSRVSLGLNVWLPGPAGSGKTTAAWNVAKALGLDFYHSGKVLMEHQLIGYKDAHGVYHRTAFRDAYELGGVFLQDEADGSEAKALLALNMAIENGEMAFPDGIISKHANFRLIAAANTFGLGGDADYVGRNTLDKATLDRFVFIPWLYDEEFEMHLATNVFAGATEWVKRVQILRANAKAQGLRVLITPRASIMGAKMLAAKFPQEEVEEETIRKAMTNDQWNAINKGRI